MTEVKFFSDGNTIIGFSISGHSSVNCDDEEGKLVCSAVSSAAYLTANTILEVIGEEAQISVDDALMVLKVEKPSIDTVTALKGFKLHIEQLSLQYNDRISILSEV